MDDYAVLGIAIALAMDAFAIAMAVGMSLPQITGWHLFRLAWHFGFFQAIMPIVGWLAGQTATSYLPQFDHWFAFGLLAFIGGRMVRESLTERDHDLSGDPTRGLSLIALSVATSIDALAVGLSLSFLHVSILFPSLVIGVVAAAMTVAGLLMGGKLGQLVGRRMETVGGLILVAIGLRVLLQDIMP